MRSGGPGCWRPGCCYWSALVRVETCIHSKFFGFQALTQGGVILQIHPEKPLTRPPRSVR